MDPRNPHAEQPRVDVAALIDSANGAVDSATRLIDLLDERIERYHSHLGSVYRVGRAASVLVGSALLGAAVVDVAIGTPPVVPVLRLAGSAVCLVACRWLRADERAWRAGR